MHVLPLSMTTGGFDVSCTHVRGCLSQSAASLAEELQTLREENQRLKALVAELLPLKEQLAQANARIKELEDRLAKTSRTSSKPPSSDGLARPPRSSRRPSGKSPGGQLGHGRHTLQMVEQPEQVVSHRPKECDDCGQDLSRMAGRGAQLLCPFSTVILYPSLGAPE
jgi:DNA repair exonuclease SbcCD ATPase subunit